MDKTCVNCSKNVTRTHCSNSRDKSHGKVVSSMYTLEYAILECHSSVFNIEKPSALYRPPTPGSPFTFPHLFPGHFQQSFPADMDEDDDDVQDPGEDGEETDVEDSDGLVETSPPMKRRKTS